MKRSVFSLVWFVFALSVHAQTLSLSTTQLNFGTKQTNTKDSLTFRVCNKGNSPVSVTDINTFKSAFSVRDTSFVVRAHDSVTVKVYFRTNHNVTWNDVLVVENTAGRGSLTLRLTGTGTRPTWLLADGITRSFTDTTSALKFDDIPAGSYYIVVCHGNHLAVMSRQRYTMSSIPSAAYEFALSSTSAYGASSMKEVVSGVFALYAGDANESGIVTAADANLVFGQLNLAGYNLLDANLSGIVSAADANIVFGNLNRGSQVP